MPPPRHAGLRHLALNVRHLDEMKRFYVDLLGFAVEWESDPDNVYLSSGSDNLALHRSPARAASPPSSLTAEPSVSLAAGGALSSGTAGSEPPHSALDHFGLIVRHANEVDQWAAFLESEGVTMVARPKTHRDGARSCYFADPDGNHVQIIHHPPISGKM